MHGALGQLTTLLIAQTGDGGSGDVFSSFVAPFAIVIVVLYLMVIRPAGKERKQHQSMLDALKRGDEVVTQSGILGKVTDLAADCVTLEVARNTKVRFLRSAIAKKYVEKKAEEATEKAKA